MKKHSTAMMPVIIVAAIGILVVECLWATIDGLLYRFWWWRRRHYRIYARYQRAGGHGKYLKTNEAELREYYKLGDRKL